MVDVALVLHAAGHRGRIFAASRHGLLPQPHAPHAPLNLSLPPELPITTRALVRFVRQAVAQAAAQGQDWRAVIDALRPVTQPLWGQLADRERRRFLRHVRAYWDVHRHRIAPAVAATLASLRATGQLQVYGGRIQGYASSASGVAVRLALRHGGLLTLPVAHVVNCTGPSDDYARQPGPLWKMLFAQGLARPDPLLGLWCAPDGRVLNAAGEPSDRLLTIGPPLKGALWESVAVPELRTQAAALAAHCAAFLAARW